MDAEVTDSAGTPTGPEGGAEDERAPGTDAAGGGGGDGTGSASEPGTPAPGDSGGSDGSGGWGPGPEPESGAGTGADDDPDLHGPGTTAAAGPAPGAATPDGPDRPADSDAPADTSGTPADTDASGTPAAPAPAPGSTHHSDPGAPGVPGDDRPGTPGGPLDAHSGHHPPDDSDTHHTTPFPVEPKDGTPPPGAKRRRPWVRWAALGTSLVLLAASGTAWWIYRKFDGNITTDVGTAAELEAYEKERPLPIVLNAQNILLLGSDSRSGKGNRKYGRDDGGSQRADTVILLHIAADRRSSTAVSLPRDLMVTIPSCRRPDGTRSRSRLAQFNSAFERGGAACTIRTVERMTGVRIDHHMVVDFRGFKEMVDAVDGVEICLKEPIDDPAARLKLRKGRQTLNGEQALGYVRARKSLGDGSDTERMSRQQQFLGSLVKKVQSNGVLLNPRKLYGVLDAATKSLTTDPGLDSLKDLYDLTRAVRSIPTERVQFLTVPRQPYSGNPNRDELVEPKASQLFRQLREDTPITVVPPGGRDRSDRNKSAEKGTDSHRRPDDTGPASPSPAPAFSGTNAAVGLCE
ncbi:LCP family protein [Streptomyces sp. NPDC051018]|uniref:LCP family protein n=1 Tax=Streptomyces sp. NPDC051018 TaxID=3365639 RepID=UPI0037ABB237